MEDTARQFHPLFRGFTKARATGHDQERAEETRYVKEVVGEEQLRREKIQRRAERWTDEHTDRLSEAEPERERE